MSVPNGGIGEIGPLVLVACSGGGDSMALAEAVAHEQRHASWRAGAVVVDHALQPGSGEVADRVAGWLADLGLDPVEVVRVSVTPDGSGLEAAARDSRYAALADVAERLGAAAVLLGHTLDDQAEQVLLGLVRGSGARSLAGMPSARGLLRRPLLRLTRAECRQSCTAEGVPWWDDPMNEDTDVARVRARRAVADLEADLGPGVVAALGRTADQLREDADHLDALADEAVRSLGAGPWGVEDLAALPRAVRTRVWRRLLVIAGAPAGQVSTRHTEACDALLTRWHGQGPAHVPGGVRVLRRDGRIAVQAGPATEDRARW
ncbi:tRNA lysidine(34) synthetase TilS [Knoellia aerolata]|uniref:tRNA(Ile)-lysidine synthase n=1 Tax=Knoellia aerolata DSM 18566 TaxID=1385519 RepID=A0A0A0JX59_9MICO|nr:tRNA lysidine(34) synthetase TilS [Knoellia aerolata]KGN40171.1 tRNA(Ile)-lysidine synthetase [Knoellia aerolata DSM 18566]